MDAPFLGMIIIFGGNFQINGWAFCNGQLLSIAQNTALFSLLGTTYGGNGQTTFGLPNLQGRVPVGFGQGPGLSPYSLGQVGGTETVTMQINQMPAHTHIAQLQATSTAAASGAPNGALLATQPRSGGVNVYAAGTADTPMSSSAIQVSVTGNTQPIPNLQPYLAINYLIALQGIYPSRN